MYVNIAEGWLSHYSDEGWGLLTTTTNNTTSLQQRANKNQGHVTREQGFCLYFVFSGHFICKFH